MTTHDHCDHDLTHCSHCDVVTCSKCKAEWGAQKPCTLNHWPTYIPYYSPPVFPRWNHWQAPYVTTNGITHLGSSPMLQMSSRGKGGSQWFSQ